MSTMSTMMWKILMRSLMVRCHCRPSPLTSIRQLYGSRQWYAFTSLRQLMRFL